MRTILRLALWCSLTAPLCPGARAQTVLQPGSTLQVLPGTTLRFAGTQTWQLPVGAQVVNDGTIELGPGSALNEAEGAAITGQGVERAARQYATPLIGADPGGLGLVLDLPQAPDSLTVVRGHATWADTAGRTSVARWYTLSLGNGPAAGSLMRFRYDPAELGGIPENDLALHRQLTDTTWEALLSTPAPMTREVAAELAHGTGRYTLFEGGLITSVAERGPGPAALLYPNPASGQFNIRSETPVRTVDLFDGTGRLVRQWSPPAGAPALPFAISGLAPGVYRVLVNGRIPTQLIVQ